MTTTEAKKLGQEAHAAGAPRMVPQEIIVGNNEVGNGIKAAKAWYKGWDNANLGVA